MLPRTSRVLITGWSMPRDVPKIYEVKPGEVDRYHGNSWEPMLPSFLGVISPTYFCFFNFSWFLGAKGSLSH